LIVAAAATGIAGVVPALALGGPGAGHLDLDVLPGGDLGIPLSGLASSPAAVQRHGIAVLSGILVMLTIAALAVSVVTILALSVLRGRSRQSEVVVRRAVGATRGQMVVSGFIEGAGVAAVALTVGGTAGFFILQWAASTWPGAIGPLALVGPALALVGVGVLILFGMLVPIATIRRARPATTPSTVPPGFAAATVQLGLSCAVLLAAGQLGRHAHDVLAGARQPTLRGGEILEVDSSANPSERATRYAVLLDQLRRTGTYEIVSLSSPGALMGLGSIDVVVTDCGRCSQGGIATPLRAVSAIVNVVSPDTFRAMDVPVLGGRDIASHDGWRSERVALVSRTLAAEHFEGGMAVGRQLQLGQGSGPWFRVVGVVEDRTPEAVGGGLLPRYAVYASALQLPPRSVELLVRPIVGRGYDRTVLRASVGAVGQVRRAQPESEWRAAIAAPTRWFARLVSLTGWLVLGMAVLGTVAVLHLWVTAMMPELAVRRAVGARRRDIFRLVMSRAVGIGVLGVAVGVWVGELLSLPLASAFAGLPDVDLRLVPRVALILLAAALGGGLIPAWRACRAGPAALTAKLDGG
jgi:hypothetical protein